MVKLRKLLVALLFVPWLLLAQEDPGVDPAFLGQFLSSSGPVAITDGLISYWNLNDGGGASSVDVVPGNLHTLKGYDITVPVTGVITNGIRTTINTLLYASNSAAAFQAGSGVSFSVSGWWRTFADPATGDGIWCKKWDPSTAANQQWKLWMSAGASGNPSFAVHNNAGTLISVTNTSAISGFNHLAFGFDSPNQVIWIQVNGNTRVTAACTEVRTGANDAVIISGNQGSGTLGTGPATDADEIGFWQRPLTLNEISELYNFGAGWAYPFSMPRSQQITVDWANIVIGNGGAAISATTSNSVIAFNNSIITNSLWPKIRTMSIFATDSLIAAISPLKGPAIWVNVNFVAGDLNTNGLKGNGSNKWLDMGIAPVPAGASQNVGLTCITSIAGANDMLMGAHASDYANAVVLQDSSAAIYYDCPYQGGVGRILVLTNSFGGYISANRTALNDQRLYIANETVPHSQLGAANTATVTRTDDLVTMGCFRNNGASSPLYSPARMSFAALHDGLTQAESLALYNAIRSLRLTFGGGYGAFSP